MTSLLANQTIRDAVLSVSVAQYHRMGEAGIIDKRTELIHGVIFQKKNKSPRHTSTVKSLIDMLQSELPDNFELRKEEPLTLATSEPEPDIAIVRVGSYDPNSSHPSSAAWVIEVAVTSEAIDRAKASVYAAAGIPEYWLVLPEKGIVERFTNPRKDVYEQHVTTGFDQQLESLAPLTITVDLRTLPSGS